MALVIALLCGWVHGFGMRLEGTTLNKGMFAQDGAQGLGDRLDSSAIDGT